MSCSLLGWVFLLILKRELFFGSCVEILRYCFLKIMELNVVFLFGWVGGVELNSVFFVVIFVIVNLNGLVVYESCSWCCGEDCVCNDVLSVEGCGRRF